MVLERVEALKDVCLEIEERSYYTNHCTVGHDLAERWELPPELRTVIRDHHTPLRTHKEGSLVNIVRLANHVVNDTLSRSDVKRVCKDLGIHPGEVERLRLDTDLATTHDELQPAASTASAT